MAVSKKKKVAVAISQFTFSGILYKLGDTFTGKKGQIDSLIIKNLIKWQ